MLTKQGITTCDQCGKISSLDREQLITIWSVTPIFVTYEIEHIHHNAKLATQQRQLHFCDMDCLVAWFKSLEVG